MYYYFDKILVKNLSSLIIQPTEICPKFTNIMIGSNSCCDCKHNEENTDDYVICEILNKERE